MLCRWGFLGKVGLHLRDGIDCESLDGMGEGHRQHILNQSPTRMFGHIVSDRDDGLCSARGPQCFERAGHAASRYLERGEVGLQICAGLSDWR